MQYITIKELALMLGVHRNTASKEASKIKKHFKVERLLKEHVNQYYKL